ncbi:hypothetical protein [Burkholderia gladioli]|uniref:hypothetical protein n=1 Tax=Burkholderia gladioli TaxID=28095 RepID=UPI001641B707|nr:hypothetical protein [Burkholderia gladioli]MBJ9663178.1 hypothetical protein [Burkholderia gladioli]
MNARYRMIAAAVVVAAASLGAGAARAEMVQFKSGQVLKADQLNQNFDDARQRLDDQAAELKVMKFVAGGLAALSIVSLLVATGRRRRRG